MSGKLTLILFMIALLILGVIGAAQQGQVEPMEKRPVFTVKVVSRTTKAVNYRHRGGSTKVDLEGTELMPEARGEARVESKTGRLEINAKLERMQPANKFGLEYLTYVLWAITPEGRANNLGEIVLNDGRSELHATTDLQAFGLIVTAEPYFAVTQPSELVVAQNIIRPDTKGRVEAIDVKYELLPRGLYASQVEPIRDAVYGIDTKAPLDLFEARNAVRIARAAGAEQYASSTFAKAQQLLNQAEDYYRRKQGPKPIGTVAREAAQTAEEARVMTLKRQQEEKAEQERAAAAEREAKAKAEAEARTTQAKQAEAERAEAAQREAQAQAAAQQAQAAAQAEAQQRQQAEAERAAAQQARTEAEQAKQQAQLAAQQAEQARQQAENEKAQMRARLLQQLNNVLQTKDTARGLIATMPDVLFATGSATLKPAARERLAKVAGILLSYPDIRLEIDGHTDNVGSETYNEKLSERRAEFVRTFLAQQGVAQSMTTRGLGPTEPIASNATPAGRQQNRRVELVVSGDVIGAAISNSTGATPK